MPYDPSDLPPLEYRVVFSGRKTLAVQVGPRGTIVRAPYRTPQTVIEAFVRSRRAWILDRTARVAAIQAHKAAITPFTPGELDRLKKEAARVIPERVRFFAPLVGVTYARVSLRFQRTRWGSCSANGNLSFNCLLMLLPPDVRDAVIVHELSHLKVMGHSRAFYEQVLRVMPDYHARMAVLKKLGPDLISRLPTHPPSGR